MEAAEITQIIYNTIHNIYQFLLYPELYPEFKWLILFLEILFLIISGFFIGVIISALIKTSWLKRMVIWDLKEFLTYRAYESTKVSKEWIKIEKRLKTNRVSEAKLAIIEADVLLDKALKITGYGGESVGERLEKITIDIMPNLEKARNAHKVRNDIIHDPTYQLSLEEAKKIVGIYKEALSHLEAI